MKDRRRKTKCILFKYKNPLSNSVQSINFKSVLTSLQNGYRNLYGSLQGRKQAVADQKGCFIKECVLYKKKKPKGRYSKVMSFTYCKGCIKQDRFVF